MIKGPLVAITISLLPVNDSGDRLKAKREQTVINTVINPLLGMAEMFVRNDAGNRVGIIRFFFHIVGRGLCDGSTEAGTSSTGT